MVQPGQSTTWLQPNGLRQLAEHFFDCVSPEFKFSANSWKYAYLSFIFHCESNEDAFPHKQILGIYSEMPLVC